MKKTLIYLFAIYLFAACNNNGMMGGGGWSTQDKNTFMNSCNTDGNNNPKMKQICSCVLEKLQKKYRTANQMNGGDQVVRQMTLECMNNGNTNDNDNGGGNMDNMNDDNNNNGNNNFNNDNDNNQEGNWTKQQRQQYVYGCAQAAQQNFGYSQEQANSYCECLTKKVESQYTFKQVSKMTAQDFSTEEWENARAECQPRY